MDTNREEWVCRTFLELADTLTQEFDLLDLATMLTERCVELLDSAEVGILLADEGGTLRVITASTDRMHVLARVEIHRHEGPSFDAFHTGEAILNVGLDRARWPRFAARAIEVGYRAAHAVPMRYADVTVGA